MGPASGLSWPVIMRNSVVLPAPLGADDADDAAGRQLEGEFVDQQIVAVAFLEMVEVDDVLAEPLGGRNVICATVCPSRWRS